MEHYKQKVLARVLQLSFCAFSVLSLLPKAQAQALLEFVRPKSSVNTKNMFINA